MTNKGNFTNELVEAYASAMILKFEELHVNEKNVLKDAHRLDSEFLIGNGEESMKRETDECLESLQKADTVTYGSQVEKVLEAGRLIMKEVEDDLCDDERAADFIYMCRKLAEKTEERRKKLSAPLRKELNELKQRGDLLVSGVKELEEGVVSKLTEKGANPECCWEELKDGQGRRLEGERGIFYVKEKAEIAEIDEELVPQEYWVLNKKLLEELTEKGVKVPGVTVKKVLRGSYRCKSLNELV